MHQHIATPRSMFYPNMNLLRYLLSLGILINHYNVLTDHNVPYFISHDRIGGFFVLSGFLMYHSYSKLTGLKSFIVHRARRILPTYLFIVLICAFGLVFVSSYSFSEYFTSSGFWKYLAANLSFCNWLCPNLPGVFDSSAFSIDVVNGSLWTMKVEWVLDLSVPVFVWVILKTKWRRELLTVCIILFSMGVRGWILYKLELTENPVYSILERQFVSQMAFFYCGMLCYFWRDKINRYKGKVIGIGAILYILSPYIPYAHVVLAPPAMAMLLIGISMIGKTITAFIHTNCISYNIFLVHYPIIQLCVWFGIKDYPVWVSLTVVIALTVALALFTNKFIDRPFNKKRKNKIKTVLPIN